MRKRNLIWNEQQIAEIERRLGHMPAQKIASPPKYRNRKVVQDGMTFDSAKEARRWAVLEQMQAAGQISELRRQVAFELAPAVHLEGERRKKPALRYFADAVYMRDGVLTVEDTKSAPTRKKESYRIKKHWLSGLVCGIAQFVVYFNSGLFCGMGRHDG